MITVILISLFTGTLAGTLLYHSWCLTNVNERLEALEKKVNRNPMPPRPENPATLFNT